MAREPDVVHRLPRQRTAHGTIDRAAAHYCRGWCHALESRGRGRRQTPACPRRISTTTPHRHGGRQESTAAHRTNHWGWGGDRRAGAHAIRAADPTRRARRRSTSALTPRTRTRRARNSNRRQWFAEGEAGLPSSHSHSEGSRLRGKLKRQWSAEVKQDHASGRSLSVDPVRKNKWKNRPIQSIFGNGRG